MSTFMNSARARVSPPGSPLERPRLTVVPRVAARASRVPFVLLVMALLAGGLVGLLLLNTALERGAYQVGALRSSSAALAARQQNLEMRVAALQEPARVSVRAERLGMVQNDSTAFLVLGTGKVIGKPVPGAASNTVEVASTPALAAALGHKIVHLPAGASNSAALPAVVVPEPKPPAAGEESAKSGGDTPPGSADTTAADGRTEASPSGQESARSN
jgi:hypothetical protein